MNVRRDVSGLTEAPFRILSRISAPFTMTALVLLALMGMTPTLQAQTCTGLCLQQVSCPNNKMTTITGRVYAPNGTDPLPNVLVYIPNAPVGPLPDGVQCLQAGLPASGSPLVSTTTAIDGSFTLSNVPVGSNIPLVIQTGKWRRQFVIPATTSCANTALPNSGVSQIRFPRTQAEGDIPKIAMVTGEADALECVLRKIGIADTEFTNPTGFGGSGRVQLFKGFQGPGSTINASTPTESVLEGSTSTPLLNNYDLTMFACEGGDQTVPAAALNNILSYVNSGGRVFATHFSYDYLYTNGSLAGTAQWSPQQSTPVNQTATVNQSFPKGLQLAQWLQTVGATTIIGQVPVQNLRKDQNGVIAPTQSFLSIANPSESIQFTFNTPVGAPTQNQCGRVLFNEYHVETPAGGNASSYNTTFPTECSTGAMTAQEKMLEFSIFDLSTFVSPDMPPAASVTFANTSPYTQGDAADTETITVTNTTATTPTNPSLTLTLAVPAGLTPTSLVAQTPATSGWTCNVTTLTCTRTTGLSAGASDSVVLTFSIAANATTPETVTATAAGGGLAANVVASDNIKVLTVPLVTWPSPAAILYGTPLSSTQLDATFTANGNPVAGTPTYTPPAGSVLNPGSQTLTVAFAPTDTNTYASVNGSTTLQVNQATPTINWATPAAITYGTALSSTQLNATATFNGGPVSGTFVYTPAAGTVLNAGSGQPLSVTFTPNDTNTYTTANGGTTITVNPAPLTATAGSYSGVYDGNTHALSACVVSASPDGLTCSNNPVGPVGPGVSSGTVTPVLSGSTSNYTVTATNGSYSITQATSTVIVSCPASVTYTGTAQTPCTATVTGVGGLNSTATVTYTGNVNVGTAQANAAYSGDANHAANSGSSSFSIVAAPLTATAGSYSGIYDGSAHALSACVVSSNPDGLTCSNNPVGPVGPGVSSGTVTPVLSGSASNYTVTSNNGSYSITPATVTITAGSYSGTYDGAAHAPSACTSSNAGVTCTNNPASVGPASGSGTVTAVPSTAPGTGSNYTITVVAGSYSIAQTTSAVTLNCPASVTYTGGAQTPCTATVTGSGGLNAAVPVTYTTNVSVGTAHAMATFSGDANHTGSSNSATFAITAVPLTVKAGSYSGSYDGATHALSACTVSSNPDGLTCTNNPAGPVGPDVSSGTITPVLSGSASNYTVTSNNGSYSITPVAVTITAGSYSGTYDGAAHAPSACTSSKAGVTCTNSPASVGPAAGSGTVTPTAVYTTGVAADYTLTTANGSYSIGRRAASVTPNAASKTYGAPDPTLTGTTSGFLPADNVTASYSRASGETISGSPYTISATLAPAAALANYTVTYNTAGLTITKASTTTTIAVTTTQTVSGTTATITATVAPQFTGTPTGTVTYLNGTTVLGSAPVGTPFTTGVLPAGSDQLSASYGGDTNFNGSVSGKTTVTSVAPTTVQLIIPVPFVLYPLPVAYTVIVPLKNFQLIGGTVTIYDGTTAISTVPILPTGTIVGVTLPPLSAGTHNLRAVYNGDSHYPVGQSPVVTVTVAKLF